MRELFVIAKREFLERVKSKWFVAMTLLWPVLMVAMIVIPALLAGRGSEGARVQIADKSGKLAPTIQAVLGLGLEWKMTTVPGDTPEPELLRRIRTNEINGYLVVAEDVMESGRITYSGDNASSQTVQIKVQLLLREVLRNARAEVAGISPDQLAILNRPAVIETQHTTGTERVSGGAAAVIGYLLAYLIFIAITVYAVSVMRSVIIEKSSRVVELLVASTTPRAMMAGKILGVGAAGLLQIFVWITIGAVALAYQDALLGLFGAAPKGSMLPSLSLDQVAVTLTFFTLGYLFYSAMYAAVGAMVSAEQDAQQAQMPITMILVIGTVLMLNIPNDPRGTSAVVTTLVPFWSPMLMPLRYFLGGATLSQVALSLGILALSTYLVARAAAKIYRVGILMYGKRPGLRELVRWLRY